MSASRDIIRKALHSRSDCVPVDRFDSLGSADAAHIASCPRCQTELALYREFTEAVPSESEGAAVEWIRAETARRWRRARNNSPRLLSRLWTWVPVASIGAVLLLLVLVNRGPSLPELPADPSARVYRSAAIEVVEPVGDLQSAPAELKWRPVAGATRYVVRITEVDDTIVWQGVATEARAALPSAVRARIVPAKTLLWSVTAEDARGNAVASSTPEKFRVRSRPIPLGE